MRITKTTESELHAALAECAPNLMFRRIDGANAKLTAFTVTLTVKSSKGMYGRLGFSRKDDGERRAVGSAVHQVSQENQPATVGGFAMPVVTQARQQRFHDFEFAVHVADDIHWAVGQTGNKGCGFGHFESAGRTLASEAALRIRCTSSATVSSADPLL